MKKLSKIFGLLSLLVLAAPAFAQTPAATAGTTSVHISNGFLAILGLGIAVVGAGLGQGKIGAAACESVARNPGAKSSIQTFFFLGLAFVESLVLFVFVMAAIAFFMPTN